ncbi:Coiled-coil domain-containing protein 40 [Batrachochytrium dendrobatidis]
MTDIAGDQDTQSEIDGTRDESFQQETDTSDKQSTSFDTSSSTILHITEPAVKSHSSLNSTSRVSITLPPLPTDSTYSLSDLSFQKKESDGIDYSDEYALAHEESVIEAMRPLHHGNTMSEVSLNQVETIENINENYDEAYNNERPYIQRENTNTVHERSDDTEQYPDEEDTALLDASHPLMKRIQDAIHHQLTTHINKLELEVREKEEMARKEIKRREEVGVELYTLQQQLARQQAMLEETEDNFAIIRGLREEGDRTLKHTVAEYKREQEKYQLHSKNLEQHKLELEKISRSLRQVDLYNEELRSRILVVKRSTLKAEDDIMKQEIEKKRQDYFIDHLTEQLRKLQERRAVYDNQLQAQQRETKAAVETLQDAATEMEAIQFEKRQLLNQWKSSLMGLQRRDDVLLQLEKAIEKSNETIASMEREIGGFRRALRQAQTEGEQLTMILGKLENEIDYIKRQIATINDQQEKLKETYTVYMKSLGHAEKDLGQLQQERQAVQQETNAVKKAWTQNAAAIQKLEQEIADRLQVQLSLEKGTQSFNRDGTKLRASIHEKESNIANIQNELSSIKLESLNVAERIKAMKAQATTLDDEVTEKNNLIGKYEQEIRRRNDELGKRASDMDLLNKKYSQVTGGNEASDFRLNDCTCMN